MEYEDYDDADYIDEGPPPETIDETLHLTVLYVSFGIVALFGNGLILRALLKYKKLRIPLFIAVCAIAITDLFFVTVSIPSAVYEVSTGEFIHNETWGTINSYVYSVTSYIVAYHMIGLSVVRGFILTDRSHKFPKFCHVITASVAVCLIVVSANVPLLMNRETNAFSLHCSVDKSAKSKREFLFKVFFSYIIPVFGIFAVYIITRSLRKRYFDESYPKEERHLSRFITVTILVYILCQSPVNIVSLVLFNRDAPLVDTETPSCGLFRVRRYLLCLSTLDKALRPVVYAGLSKHIGESMDEVINCTACQRRTDQDEIDNQPMNPSTSTIIEDPV